MSSDVQKVGHSIPFWQWRILYANSSLFSSSESGTIPSAYSLNISYGLVYPLANTVLYPVTIQAVCQDSTVAQYV